MEKFESDYSEDFEEEVLSSAKPSAGSLSVRRRRQRQSCEPEGGVGRDRQSKVSQLGEDTHSRLRRQRAPERQPTTTSKSTGALGKPLVVEAKYGRRTQSFLPRRTKPRERTSKFVERSPARDRQLSALNHTIHGLQNKLSERGRELEDLSKENRLLNRLQRRQDREWTRIQCREDELPQILQRHEQEVRALRKQLRKSHEEVMVGQQRLGELQEELRRLTDTNHKLERVVGKKKLLERDQLTVQLEEMRQQLADRGKRVAELERGLEASNKTHQKEVRELRLRNRALGTENTTLRDTANELHSQLKEKTKEMNVLNIYTQRIPRNPAKPLPPSPQPPTPTPSVTHQASQTSLSCPPFKTVSMQHRSPLKAAASQTDVVGSRPTHCVDTYTQTLHESVPVVPVNITATSVAAVKVKVESSPAQNMVTGGDIMPQPTAAETTAVAGNRVQPEQSKHMLIQKLRELDSQKVAPGSDPMMPSVQTNGTATVVTTQPHQGIGVDATLSPEIKPSASQAKVATHEQERKQLLLAKLMAIDEGSDPNSVKTTPKSSQKQLPLETKPANSQTAGKITSSSSSINSWHEVIENMHQGKPAYASEDDPFGSRTRLSSTKKTLAKGRMAVEDIRGRRDTGVREQTTFVTETSEATPGVAERLRENGDIKPSLGAGSGGGGSYKPSFGRRATNAALTPGTLRDQAGDQTKDTPRHPVFGEPPPAVAGRGRLLPQRPKAEQAAMKSYDVMPGAIVSEPDDLEELVL